MSAELKENSLSLKHTLLLYADSASIPFSPDNSNVNSGVISVLNVLEFSSSTSSLVSKLNELFKEASVDTIECSHSYIPDEEAAAYLYTLSKPGGKLVIKGVEVT